MAFILPLIWGALIPSYWVLKMMLGVGIRQIKNLHWILFDLSLACVSCDFNYCLVLR
jgi:hypothetical protein